MAPELTPPRAPFSHPISAVVVNGMEVSTPPLFLFTNDAFATMLQFLPVQLLSVSVHEIHALILCSSPYLGLL